MRHKKRLLGWSVNFLVILGALSLNIYLPSLLKIRETFHTNPSLLKLSITLFLLGYALSQLFWGSLSERFGRKKPVLIGLAIGCLGAVTSMVSVDITMFNCARFVEGVGIGCASVLGRALVADIFDRTDLSRASAYMATFANVIPALAPLLGGYLLLWLGWRSIFAFLSLYTAAIFLLFAWKIKETHPDIKGDFTLLHALYEYVHVFCSRDFLSYVCPLALIGGGLVGYYAASPFIFIKVLGLRPHIYSYFSFLTVGMFVGGANLSHFTNRKLGFSKTVTLGIIIAILSGVTLLVLWLFSKVTIATVVGPMMIYSFGVALATPNTYAGAMAAVKRTTGAGSAVIGASTSGAAAVLAFALNSLNLASLLSLGAYITCLSVLALLLFLLIKPKMQDPLSLL